MTTYVSSIHVNVPPEAAFSQVFELMMKNVDGSPEPGTPAEGLGAAFRYGFGLLGWRAEGTCTITEYVPSETLTLQWRGPERATVGSLRGVWTFVPDDAGTTITVRSYFEPRIPILHTLGSRLMMFGFRRSEFPAMKAEMERRFQPVQSTS